MRQFFLAFVFAAAVVGAFAVGVTLAACADAGKADGAKAEPEADAQSLEGVWLVQSNEYDGACVIRKTGPTYLVSYNCGYVRDGTVAATHTVGVGFRTGDIFAVAWNQGDKTTGLTVYSVRGKVMEGRWTTLPGGAINAERLTLLKMPAKEI